MNKNLRPHKLFGLAQNLKYSQTKPKKKSILTSILVLYFLLNKTKLLPKRLDRFDSFLDNLYFKTRLKHSRQTLFCSAAGSGSVSWGLQADYGLSLLRWAGTFTLALGRYTIREASFSPFLFSFSPPLSLEMGPASGGDTFYAQFLQRNTPVNLPSLKVRYSSPPTRPIQAIAHNAPW